MLLSDVVKVLGDRPLGEFPWGCVVMDTVNLFADINLKLTLTSTGNDLIQALDAMSESNRVLLNNAQLDTNRPCVITTPAGGGMVIEHGDVEGVIPPFVLGHFQVLTALVVVVVVISAGVMFASLSANEGTDWKEIGFFFLGLAKSYIGL